MLMNFKELLDWLDKHIEDDYSIDKQILKMDLYTPLKYRGIYEKIGIATVWNNFGSPEYSFCMYRPVGNGTVVYDVE